MYTDVADKSNFKKPVVHWMKLACTWFKILQHTVCASGIQHVHIPRIYLIWIEPRSSTAW